MPIVIVGFLLGIYRRRPAHIERVCTLYTHNRFTALLEYVRDHPGEQVPER